MLASQRDEFKAQLSALYGAWGRNIPAGGEEGYWKGLTLMSLGDFARCVERALQRYSEEPDMRLPDVGGIWALKRSLRSVLPPINREVSSTWNGDKWDITANRHLLDYIRTRVPLHRARYVPDAGGLQTERRTQCLVRAKHRWAQLMRETQEDGRVDSETQKAVWTDEMQQAERQIDALTTALAA